MGVLRNKYLKFIAGTVEDWLLDPRTMLLDAILTLINTLHGSAAIENVLLTVIMLKSRR